MNGDPLAEMIEQLNRGEEAAAERAFLEYEPYLRMAVRRQLSGRLRSKLDSMDIVQSVWADVLGGFRRAAWQFSDPSHLRAFLVRVARNRLIDRERQLHRALEKERPLELTGSGEMPKAVDPRASQVAEMNELWGRMLDQCAPNHREILVMKRQGLPLAEIARRTGLHEGSIRRIIYELARRMAPRTEDSSETLAISESRAGAGA
jgi:RNA polymerase sigma factor (sigma-70 family)